MVMVYIYIYIYVCVCVCVLDVQLCTNADYYSDKKDLCKKCLYAGQFY